MLRPSAPDLKVYLHRAAIDMRAGRNGLDVCIPRCRGPFDQDMVALEPAAGRPSSFQKTGLQECSHPGEPILDFTASHPPSPHPSVFVTA